MSGLTFSVFRSRFQELVDELGMNWEAVGFLTADGKVYPFGTDTKVISTVFEAHAAPLIHTIADEHGCVVVYWFTVNRSIGLCVGGCQGFMNWKALR